MNSIFDWALRAHAHRSHLRIQFRFTMEKYPALHVTWKLFKSVLYSIVHLTQFMKGSHRNAIPNPLLKKAILHTAWRYINIKNPFVSPPFFIRRRFMIKEIFVLCNVFSSLSLSLSHLLSITRFFSISWRSLRDELSDMVDGWERRKGSTSLKGFSWEILSLFKHAFILKLFKKAITWKQDKYYVMISGL